MLKQRIITAVIMLAVLIGTLLAPTPWLLLVLLVLIAAAAAWEWLRLTLAPSVPAIPIIVAAILAPLLLALSYRLFITAASPATVMVANGIHYGVIPVVALIWIFGAPAAVVRANTQMRRHTLSLSVFGVLAVVALWYSLATLFMAYGAWFLISLMALIWFADSVAYFTGRALGKHKLAPRISPGKTWEGAAGGIAGALIWMVLSNTWPGSFADMLSQRWGMLVMLAIAAALAALSIVGDLFESLLKRRAGMKDSSQLLPGHGGVYDRIDALFPVVPVAFMLVSAL